MIEDPSMRPYVNVLAILGFLRPVRGWKKNTQARCLRGISCYCWKQHRYIVKMGGQDTSYVILTFEKLCLNFNAFMFQHSYIL